MMNEKVPKVIIEWFNQVVEDCRKQPGKENTLVKIQAKVEHTARVVRWGELIMKGEMWKWNYEQGLAVCMLHDIGRFPQALNGTYQDKKTFSHAKRGRDLWESTNLDLSSFEGNKEEIAEAIGEHNNIYYRGNNVYVKLARDADNLAIMEELEDQVEGKLKEKGLYQETGEMNEEMVEDYQQNKLINTRDAKTVGEWMLCVRAWEKTFNFETTRKLFFDNEFDKKLKSFYLRMFPEKKEEAEVFTREIITTD